MGRFREFADLCRALAATRGRLEKRALVADYLRALPEEDLPHAVAFLTARAFPVSDPRALSVRGLPRVTDDAEGEPLGVADVAAAFADIAEASGPGARARREARLVELTTRASPLEREYLARIIGGEMRTGVSDGLVLEAIAAAVGAAPDAARRAALFLGDLSAVAMLARRGGAAALEGAEPRLFVPLLPMLAEIADGWETCSPRTAARPRSSSSTTARACRSTRMASASPSGRGACRTSPRACPTWSCAPAATRRRPSSSTARSWRSAPAAGRCPSRS